MNATGDSLFRATLSGATLSGTTVTIAAVDSARAASIADSAKTANFSAVLKNADSTSIRNYSNSLYLKNADSTSIRNYSSSLYLKNADSTSIRNYSSSLYLKNADSTTLKNSILATVDVGYLNSADSTTIKNGIAATYTTLVQRGTDPTRAIVRENTKISRGDTLALFTFGGGGGNATDTSAFTTSTYYGSFFNKGRDSIKVTSLKVVMSHGIGTDTLQVQVSWDDSLAGTGAVNLNTAALPVNSTGPGTEDTAFDNAVIPPNVWVWCKTPVVVAGRKPTYMSATLSGYRTRP
jgi:hypothetical protein